jgi:hypothetical protein
MARSRSDTLSKRERPVPNSIQHSKDFQSFHAVLHSKANMSPEEKIAAKLEGAFLRFKSNRKLIVGLILINLGVFVASSALLPRRSSYRWSGPVSRLINSRERWDIPWLVTLGSVIVSTGVVVIFRTKKD